MRYYTPPDDLAGTVFDPSSPTYGPIMAAIQKGDLEEAIERLQTLVAHENDPSLWAVVSWPRR